MVLLSTLLGLLIACNGQALFEAWLGSGPTFSTGLFVPLVGAALLAPLNKAAETILRSKNILRGWISDPSCHLAEPRISGGG
jgi:hypothetical protein